MCKKIVGESVQLIKEALKMGDNKREENLLSYKNADKDLEALIQQVLSSFAFTLENAALEEYHSETSYIPPETTRLVSIFFYTIYDLENFRTGSFIHSERL